MTSLKLSFVFLLFVLIQRTDGYLRLEVDPTDITPGLTQSLTVNCSFSYTGVTNMSGIITLTVSRSEVNGSQFVDLASVDAFTPDQLTILPGVDGNVSGHIDTNNESFVSIVWTYPTSDQTGQYRCQANGMDNSGSPRDMFQTMEVKLQQSDWDELTARISQLQYQLEIQESLAKNRSDEINKLLSLTQRQSQIISAQKSQLDNQAVTITGMESTFNSLLAFFPFHISSEYNSHLYLIFKHEYQNATIAQKTCQFYGTYLAQINNASENQFVENFLNQYESELDFVLVSGTDDKHEGNWTYSGTDDDLEFTNWNAGSPQITMESNCVWMYKGYQWQWFDWSCTYNYGGPNTFLCELEIV